MTRAGMTERPRRGVHAVGLGLMVLIGLAAGIGVAELVMRLQPPRGADLHAYVDADPILHHRLRAGYIAHRRGVEFRINAIGLKDREYPAAKPAGVFRVLMLGDSYTEGFGLRVEHTMPKQAEDMLASRSCRRPVEVMNAGVSSYSPILEYLYLKERGLALDPDLVVLNFDMTDVHDDLVRTKIGIFGPDSMPLAVPDDRRAEAVVMLPPVLTARPLRFLGPVEHSVNRLEVYQSFRTTWLGEVLLGAVRLRTLDQLAALGLMGNVHYDPIAITRDEEQPGELEAWAVTERYIAGIAGLARERGIAFVVVVYPHPYQVSAGESPEGRRRVGAGPGFYASERPFRRLAEIGQRVGIPVLDLVALFRERSAQDGPLFFPDDMHHNERGARVFGQGVVNGLIGLRLVPCG
jgi:acetyltransferase AlgX (SGNH hydrolase-like protein)